MSGRGLRSVTSVTRKVASGEVKRLPAPRAPRPELTVVSAPVLLVAAPLVSFSIIFNLKETTLKFYKMWTNFGYPLCEECRKRSD